MESAQTSNPLSQPVDQTGVHATHCCPRHGCKYGYGMHEEELECPVSQGTVPPLYPENNGCERCEMECEERGVSFELLQRVEVLLAQPEMQGVDYQTFLQNAVQEGEERVRDLRALEGAEALAEEELRFQTWLNS